MDGVGKVSWFLGKYDARGPPWIELRRSCPKPIAHEKMPAASKLETFGWWMAQG